MHPKLSVRVCRYYQAEVVDALAALGYDDVTVETYPFNCDRPNPQVVTLTSHPTAANDVEPLFIGGCALVHQPGLTPAAPPTQPLRLEHCLSLIAGPSLIASTTRSGAYLITPGWLRHWRTHLRRWGFDQTLAREFFRELTSELLLLDTGIDPAATTELEHFAAYIDRPYQVRSIGLDYLQIYLERNILAWRMRQLENDMQRRIQDTNRKSAEYAMAFDLLVSLAELRTEEATIAAIQNMASLLFGCTSPIYAQVRAGQIVRVFAPLNAPDAYVNMSKNLALLGNGNTLTDGDGGFYLRIHYRRETFGLLGVHNITFPSYRDQYLNLGLAIASLCGLALANARTYSALQATEQSLRREHDLAEQLRQAMSELTSALDHERLLSQILSLLDQLIPNQIAMLLLWESDMLRVVSAHSRIEGVKLVGRQIEVNQHPFALVLQRQTPLVLGTTVIAALPPQHLLSELALKSWLGVPLLNQRQVIGMLAVGSRQHDHYSPEHARSAQVLANEMALALERVRIVAEAHTLAGTDSLTGLYNRRRFNELAEDAFREARRNGGWLSAIFLDLDHFKRVNDDFSHLVGDQVLVAVAAQLKQLRDSEIAARYGGEEFVVISSTSNLAAMHQLAERLRRAIADKPISTMSGPVVITASLGVASITPEIENLGELIWRADQALYAAKASGRNRVCSWGETL
jgi:diguanylate cyclase (GGDEF)-like protein